MQFSDALRERGLQVLECNFDSRPSEEPPKILDGELFRFLLAAIAPRVLLLHGKKIIDAATSIVPAATRVVTAERHFSRISTQGLARAIAECVDAAESRPAPQLRNSPPAPRC